MINTQDPRHQRRIALMQQLFAVTFDPATTHTQSFEEPHADLEEIQHHLPEIDTQIHAFAPERAVSEIKKVDLAILRVIMFEWKTSETPKKVLIDEGIELAKEFGTESSPRFINGVLAQLLK